MTNIFKISWFSQKADVSATVRQGHLPSQVQSSIHDHDSFLRHQRHQQRGNGRKLVAHRVIAPHCHLFDTEIVVCCCANESSKCTHLSAFVYSSINVDDNFFEIFKIKIFENECVPKNENNSFHFEFGFVRTTSLSRRFLRAFTCTFSPTFATCN